MEERRIVINGTGYNVLTDEELESLVNEKVTLFLNLEKRVDEMRQGKRKTYTLDEAIEILESKGL